MRKKHTFLLTIMPCEEEKEKLRGRVKRIQTDDTATFTTENELWGILKNMIINNVDTGLPADIDRSGRCHEADL